MRTLMTFTAIAVALAASTAAHADQQQRDELRKQLEIMNSIFTTALEQESNDDRRRHGFRERLHFDYLAGQGVVYRSHLGGHQMIFLSSDFPAPPAPPMVDIEGIDSVEIELAIADGLAAAQDSLDDIEIITEDVEGDGKGNIRVIRTVTADVRENAGEMRELRRRIRDLELAQRSAEGDEAEVITKELQQAREELEMTQKALAEARAEIATARREIEEKSEQRKAKRAEQLQQRLARFEQTMAATLCDYGRTLRALPKDEHVSFVIEGAGDSAQGGNDKIYVFTKQQLEKCSDASDLLSKATTYSF